MPRPIGRWLIIGVTAACLLAVSSGRAGAGANAANDVRSSEDSLAIVINTSNPVDNLSMSELRKVFLGERRHWPNGRRITLVMMEPGQPERKALIRDVCQMNESDFTQHFLHGVFTGEVFVSPKTLASPVGVRKFVFNVPGAIGYVRATDVDSSVKVVRVEGHLPEDREYALRIPPAPAQPTQ